MAKSTNSVKKAAPKKAAAKSDCSDQLIPEMMLQSIPV